MPYFHFKEIWTPFSLLGIRLFKETDSGALFIKAWNKPRKQITK